MKILECKCIKEKELLILKEKIKKKMTLAVIQIGNFEENKIYLRSKKKLANDLNIELIEIIFDEFNTKDEVISTIIELNNDDNITGIMIQKPIPAKFDYWELVNYIDYKKDVDGITDKNKELLEIGKGIIPCCSKAVLKTLEYYDIDISNKKIAIIGKSELVGMPLYRILSKKTETTLCDSKTTNLSQITKESDIIITSIGKANFLTKDYFKEGQIIIDIGTNYLDGKLVGDVDFKSVENINLMITPVPGGIGLLTPICLFTNLLELNNLK